MATWFRSADKCISLCFESGRSFFFFFSISMFLYSFDYFDRVVVLDTIGIEKSMMDKISD